MWLVVLPTTWFGSFSNNGGASREGQAQPIATTVS